MILGYFEVANGFIDLFKVFRGFLGENELKICSWDLRT
jgi:hypothetical protein